MMRDAAPDAGRRPRRPVLPWITWFAVMSVLTLAMLAVRPRLDKAHVALAYLLAVLGASAAGGRALGLAVAGAAFITFNYLFLPPYHTLVVADPLDWIVLVAFLVTSAVATQLLYRATATADAATQRAEEVDQLAALGAETLSAPGAEEALAAIVGVIREAIAADTCEVYRRGAEGALVRVALASRDGPPRVGTSPAPTAAAAPASEDVADVEVPSEARRQFVGPESLLRWLVDNGRSAVELADGTIRLAPEEVDRARPEESVPSAGAGVPPDPSPVVLASLSPSIAGSGLASLRFAIRPAARPRGRTLLRGFLRSSGDRPGSSNQAGAPSSQPAVRTLLLPLVVRQHTVGVLRIASGGGVALTPEQARLLVALAYYAALGVERVRLVETAERAESERRLEALRSALLTAVSHDLRTPLTTIKGIAHEVAHGADPARAAIIESEADRLDTLVGDLLDLSRIQAGAVLPNIAVNTVDELVGAALQRASGALSGRAVEVDLPSDDVLPGRFDFTQSLRILVNLLENAAKYAPPDAPITLRAQREGGRLLIRVLDRGPGVPEAERERIFEPFYRPPGTPPDVRGTGLGLSIARGLAEAQGGAMRYEVRAGGGSAFVLELPAADALPGDDELPVPS